MCSHVGLLLLVAVAVAEQTLQRHGGETIVPYQRTLMEGGEA